MISSDIIQKWLADEGLFRQKVVDENANFHFSIELGPGNAIDVVQPKGKEDLIIIGSGVTVSPEHLRKISQLNKKRKENFLWNFRLALNQMEIGLNLNHPDNVLHFFAVNDSIYEDGLSKDRLISTVNKIARAKIHGIWLVQQEFGSEGSDKTDMKDDLKSYG
jgi:hypothetical protein